jgi:hypothetical protein
MASENDCGIRRQVIDSKWWARDGTNPDAGFSGLPINAPK